MNSLPPEMIREIYTKMDASTAYEFRKTCRDYNKVFLDNPSAMPRFHSNLDIAFKGHEIEILVTLRKYFKVNPMYCRAPKVVNIVESADSQHDFVFSDSFRKILLENKPSMIVANDPVILLLHVVATLTSVLHFKEVTLVGHITQRNAILDDRILGMLVDHVVADVDKLMFCDLDFRLTNTANWHRFLKITKARTIHIQHCRLHSLKVFSEDAVMGGLVNLNDTNFLYNTYDHLANVGLKYLLRKDTIATLQIKVFVDVCEIIDKIERYLNGDFFIESLLIAFKESDRKNLVDYMERKRENSANDDAFEMTTKNGNRRAKIWIGDYNGMGRFQFFGYK